MTCLLSQMIFSLSHWLTTNNLESTHLCKKKSCHKINCDNPISAIRKIYSWNIKSFILVILTQILLDSPFHMYFIVGITSFGKKCGFANMPAVYTNVAYFVSWIEEIVWGDSLKWHHYSKQNHLYYWKWKMYICYMYLRHRLLERKINIYRKAHYLPFHACWKSLVGTVKTKTNQFALQINVE